MFIGEAPGEQEDLDGLGFVGTSGQVLWQFAWKVARIRRDDCIVANLMKTRPPGNRDPLPSEIDLWGPLLLDEIEEYQPKVIACFGRYALSYVIAGLNDGSMEMAMWNGKVQMASTLMSHCHIPVVGITHPAAGLHDGGTSFQETIDGLKTLADFDGGRTKVWKPQQLKYVMRPGACGCDGPYALDTEGSPVLYSIQLSCSNGHCWFVMANDAEQMWDFRRWISKVKPTFVMHYAYHDLTVLERANVWLRESGCDVRDTVEAAYLLQHGSFTGDDRVKKKGSLSLKKLAKKIMGVDMTDFKTTVMPHWQAECKLWAADCLDRLKEECDGHDQVIIRHAKPKKDGSQGRRLKDQIIKCDCPACQDKAKFSKVAERAAKNDAFDWAKFHSSTNDIVEAPPVMHIEMVPEAKRTEYMAKDPVSTLTLHNILMPQIDHLGLRTAYELDHRRLNQVKRMRQRGVLVDRDRLEAFKSDLEAESSVVYESVREMAAKVGSQYDDFNPGSAPQLRDLLTDMGAIWYRMTASKSDLSTDEKALEEVVKRPGPWVPLVTKILEYRSIDKFRGTYVEYLLEETDWKGEHGEPCRLHHDLNTTATFTGRLAGRLLTVPRPDTVRGKRLRSCVRAPVGWLFCSWDMGQIEPRLLGHLSGDPKFMALCVDHIYERVTALLRGRGVLGDWKLVPDDIKAALKAERQPFKAITLAVIYGKGDKSLALDLGISEIEAGNLRRQFLQQFPGVQDFFDDVMRQIRRDGFVRCQITGRIRYLPAIYLEGSRYPYSFLREEAMRQGFNHLMQSGAQGLEIETQAIFDEDYQPILDSLAPGGVCHPVIQIHDDLDMEVREDHYGTVDAFMQETIERVAEKYQFKVPIVVDGKKGPSWGEMQ